MNAETEKSREQETGLQTVKSTAADLQELRSQIDELTSSDELAPLMSSFREYAEEEYQRNRKRVILVSLAFTAVIAVLVFIPIHYGRIFLQQQEANFSAQQDLYASISSRLDELVWASGGSTERGSGQDDLMSVISAGMATLDRLSGTPDAGAPTEEVLEDMLSRVESAIEERERTLEAQE